MLGLTIRFDTFRNAEESIVHILEVEHDSPAEIAGLQPNTDYLLGTAEKVFQDTDVLFQELQANIDRPVEFFVYNTDLDEVRIVVIMPTLDWGGDGILGASVGHGYLHMLPSTACETIGRSSDSLSNANRAVNSAFGYNSTLPSVPPPTHPHHQQPVAAAPAPHPANVVSAVPDLESPAAIAATN